MSHIVNVVLLVLGLIAIAAGVIQLIRTRGQWWIGGIIVIVVGIILLALGGFISV